MENNKKEPNKFFKSLYKQERKKYSKHGERTSKMISFRADKETLDILETVDNKGRLLNQLVQQWKREQ